MSEVRDPKPWFRPRDTGTGWTPQTWQGWAVTLVFCLVIASTVQLVIPQGANGRALPWAQAARHALGLSSAGLGLVGAVVTLACEVGAFLAIAWWTSRSMKPLD